MKGFATDQVKVLLGHGVESVSLGKELPVDHAILSQVEKPSSLQTRFPARATAWAACLILSSGTTISIFGKSQILPDEGNSSPAKEEIGYLRLIEKMCNARRRALDGWGGESWHSNM
jgi:hypothetical protein